MFKLLHDLYEKQMVLVFASKLQRLFVLLPADPRILMDGRLAFRFCCGFSHPFASTHSNRKPMSTLIEGQKLSEIQKSVLPSDLAKDFVKVLTSKDNEANLEMYLTQLEHSVLDS